MTTGLAPLCDGCGRYHDRTYACPGRPVERCRLHDHVIPCPGGPVLLHEPGSVGDPHTRGLLNEPEVLLVLAVLEWDTATAEENGEPVEVTEQWVWALEASTQDRLPVNYARQFPRGARAFAALP